MTGGPEVDAFENRLRFPYGFFAMRYGDAFFRALIRTIAFMT